MLYDEIMTKPEIQSLRDFQDLGARRRQAGKLLNAVFDETLTPRQAINQWPCLPGNAEPDPSLAAAFQSLWHFEADETQQQTTVFYLDVQLDVLLTMARLLSQGLPLPEELLAYYGQSETLPSLDRPHKHDPGANPPIEYGIQPFWRWIQAQWKSYNHDLKKRIRRIKHTWTMIWKPLHRRR
jgi:hypothetical protein